MMDWFSKLGDGSDPSLSQLCRLEVQFLDVLINMIPARGPQTQIFFVNLEAANLMSRLPESIRGCYWQLGLST